MPGFNECSLYNPDCTAKPKRCNHSNVRDDSERTPKELPKEEPPYPGAKDAPCILDIVTDYGVPMRVVLSIRKDIHGNPLREYGRTVQFYDKRYRGTEYGQFIGDWFPSIFLDIPANGRFPMNGTNRDWMLDHASRRLVTLWLEHLINVK